MSVGGRVRMSVLCFCLPCIETHKEKKVYIFFHNIFNNVYNYYNLRQIMSVIETFLQSSKLVRICLYGESCLYPGDHVGLWHECWD